MPVLQKVLKRQATGFILDQLDTKAVFRGWLIKVRYQVYIKEASLNDVSL